MGYPDDFRSSAFAAAQGSPEYDQRVANAEDRAAPDVAQAGRLKAAAQVMIHAMRCVQWDKEPDWDHDWEGGFAFVEALATFDVAAFERERIEEGMEE